MSKTTILGILTIVGAVTTAAYQYVQGSSIDFVVLSTAITAGWGLIMAKDATRKPPSDAP